MTTDLALSWGDTRRLRLHAQGLSADRSADLSADVPATVRATGAVQAQDRLGELLGVATRSTGLTAGDLHRARTVDRSVVRTWLHRGTLHLVPAEDLRWLLELLGEEMDRKALKRRADLGISPEDHGRVLEFLRPELARRGPMTRAEIGDALRVAGLPCEGQATPHLLRSASMHGLICFGPDRDGDATHVLIDDWLPAVGRQPPDPGAELARRYFAAYGPAAPADFRWWSGLPAADARRAVQSVAGELVEVAVEGKRMWMTADASERIDERLARTPNRVRVLGPFDPYLLGYAKRELGVAAPLLKRINAGGGMIRSCVLIDGRLVGTWDRKRRKRGLTATVAAFELLSDDAVSQLDFEFTEISRFLDTDINWSLNPDPEAARSG